MSKKLAIKGHETRGKEIIELLEMMGGINKNMLSAHIGDVLNPHVYFLELDSSDNRIVWNYLLGLEWDGRASDMMIFTLEEFLEKYPYKLNDLALCDDGLLGIITKMEWDCEKSDMKYYISFKISDYNKWYSSKNIICTFMEIKGKKLAIKGHSTRGKEVIELLEMMGGVNWMGSLGNTVNRIYYISESKSISFDDISLKLIDEYEIFTLEEFWEKYPIKIGDEVTDLKTDKIAEVYKMHWSENNSCIYYDIKYPNNCGCQRRLMDLKPTNDVDDVHSISECKTIGQGTYAIKIADGYKFDSIDENGNIIVKSIKPKYPTTYDECCDMLNADEFVGYELMTNFPKLINARNAYWKIAGEQMGLGKPWEFENPSRRYVFTIENFGGKIQKNAVTARILNRILIFPTEEMRDTFCKNFNDLIEQCKELL